MTEVRLNIVREDGPLWFDERGHAGDREVCGMISTLLNFLVVYMDERGFEPNVYSDGHVQYDIYMSNMHVNRVFRSVVKTLEALELQYPDNIKVIK